MTVTTTVDGIKAIETTYNGVRFRSRLEARWAVFFDAVKTPWQYEPEAFHLPAGTYGDNDGWGFETELTRDCNYLPDFWLPEVESWFEVKGVQPDDDYNKMLWAFERGHGKRVLIAIGEIPYYPDKNYPCVSDRIPYPYNADSGPNPLNDFPYEFCRCGRCGRLGCEFEGRSERVCAYGRGCRSGVAGGNGSGTDTDVVAAYDKARAYRFWDPAR